MLISLFWNMSCLRVGPEQVPVSLFLRNLALFIYFIVGLSHLAVKLPLWNASLVSLVDTLLLTTMTHIALLIREKPERQTQTVTALAGTSALLGLIAFPVFSMLPAVPEGQLSPSLVLVTLGLIVWSLVVTAHILRHALSLPFMAGGFVAVVFMAVSFKVDKALYLSAV